MPSSGLPHDVRGTVVTVGTFDGVHLGHQDVIRRLVDRAGQAGLASLLVTFEPHPLEVVNPAIAPLLLTPGHEKLDALAATGLDYVAIVPFTPTLAAYEADEFVDLVLRDRFRMRELLIGHDHGLGRGRTGDVAVLTALGASRGFPVDVVAPVVAEHGVAPVSSSALRRAVTECDLDGVREALGRPYPIAGTVVHGDHRGRTIGFPTLNVVPESPRKLLPPNGVYAVVVQTPTGAYRGMMNLGPRPTVGDARVSVEAHLFDVTGDWYGAHVRIDVIARLRDVRRFASLDELVAQLGADGVAARASLTGRV
jgi:riboflavin kinase / FMN adenylyltransferase